jgi:hypothetical protein
MCPCDCNPSLLTRPHATPRHSHTHSPKRCAVAASHRMDVSMRLSPEALVGRQLRVYWEQDDAWFAGSVEAWDPKTAQHKVCTHVCFWCADSRADA